MKSQMQLLSSKAPEGLKATIALEGANDTESAFEKPSKPFDAVEKTASSANSARIQESRCHPYPDNPAFKIITGRAPDPLYEIPKERHIDLSFMKASVDENGDPEPEDDTVNGFKRLKVETIKPRSINSYVGIDTETGDITATLVPESDFIDFWAKEAWDVLADMATIFKIDLEDIRTDDDDMEMGRKAAARLYKIAQKHPKYLGWMISEKTIEGGDMMVCAMFFGGKGMSCFNAWKEKRQKAQKAKIAHDSADIEADISDEGDDNE